MQRLVGVHKEGRDILKSCRICFIHRWFKEQWGVAPRHQHQELHQQRDLNICSRWRSSLLLHQLYCYDYRDVYGFKRLCAEADRERLTIHVRSARCFMGRRYSLQLFDSVTCSPSHSRPSTEQSSRYFPFHRHWIIAVMKYDWHSFMKPLGWSSSESEWPRPLASPSTGADDPEHTGNKNRLVYCVIRSIYTIFYLFLVSVCISYKVLLPPYIASSSHIT